MDVPSRRRRDSLDAYVESEIAHYMKKERENEARERERHRRKIQEEEEERVKERLGRAIRDAFRRSKESDRDHRRYYR